MAQAQGAQPVRRFEIAAGPLDAALATFEQVTGITAAVSQEGIRSVSSPGVTGLYTPEQALQKLLADTGLTYRFTSANAVALDLKTVDASVDVVTSVEALQTLHRQIHGAAARYAADHRCGLAENHAGARRHDAARRAAQRGRHQHGGGRRRIAGGQSDDPRFQRAQRSLHRRHARFWELLSRPVQPGRGRSDSGSRVDQLRARVDGWRGESGHEISPT